jgi:hypothetical protein
MNHHIQLPNNKTQSKIIPRTRENVSFRDDVVVSDDHMPIGTPPNIFFRTLKKRMDGYYVNDKDIVFKSVKQE